MRAFDLAVALTLLSRLPIPIDHARAGERGARAAWAYPLAGLLLGALSGGALAGLAALGLAPGPAAALALALSLLLTGALHEDGLADAADGLGGGRDRAHALEIMKDSRIGAYGAAALALSLLARWSALAALAAIDPILAAAIWAAAAAASRAAMSLGLALAPSARPDGLAASQGRAPIWSGGLALALSAAIAAAATGFGAPPALTALAWSAALLGGGAVLLAARRRLGGQTGDVLGAAQQIAETLFLCALTAA